MVILEEVEHIQTFSLAYT